MQEEASIGIHKRQIEEVEENSFGICVTSALATI
jgi:hypothetical protein